MVQLEDEQSEDEVCPISIGSWALNFREFWTSKFEGQLRFWRQRAQRLGFELQRVLNLKVWRHKAQRLGIEGREQKWVITGQLLSDAAVYAASLYCGQASQTPQRKIGFGGCRFGDWGQPPKGIWRRNASLWTDIDMQEWQCQNSWDKWSTSINITYIYIYIYHIHPSVPGLPRRILTQRLQDQVQGASPTMVFPFTNMRFSQTRKPRSLRSWNKSHLVEVHERASSNDNFAKIKGKVPAREATNEIL